MEDCAKFIATQLEVSEIHQVKLKGWASEVISHFKKVAPEDIDDCFKFSIAMLAIDMLELIDVRKEGRWMAFGFQGYLAVRDLENIKVIYADLI